MFYLKNYHYTSGGGSLQHKHVMLLSVVTVTEAKQWLPSGLNFNLQLMQKKKGIFFAVFIIGKALSIGLACFRSHPVSLLIHVTSIAWCINQDCLHQGLDLLLFCSCITVMLQVALEIF